PELAASLEHAGVRPMLAVTISHEPTVGDVDQLAAMLRASPQPGDLVLGFGGGSAIDLAKAGAAMATNRHGRSVADFLEGVGQGLKLEHDPLPVIAMPTTGGTGTEATKNAVISSSQPPFKKSLRSAGMVPRLALIDPELSASLSPERTAWSGMDAITQLIESYLSRFSRPVPRALCVEGLRQALTALPVAVADGSSRPAREALAHAALMSGMALANSGLGMAHGVAAALGCVADVPHGLACAMLLPVALRVNRETCLPGLAQLAREVLGRHFADDGAAADALLEVIDGLAQQVGIARRLRDLGVAREQLDALVPAARGNSMNGNPRTLTDEQLRAILEEHW
ncbi:MAG TPA: iron-containing alcohol dehydrogenase, partial [Pirellulales bacterium]